MEKLKTSSKIKGKENRLIIKTILITALLIIATLTPAAIIYYLETVKKVDIFDSNAFVFIILGLGIVIFIGPTLAQIAFEIYYRLKQNIPLFKPISDWEETSTTDFTDRLNNNFSHIKGNLDDDDFINKSSAYSSTLDENESRRWQWDYDPAYRSLGGNIFHRHDD